MKEGEELDFESSDHEGGVYTVYVRALTMVASLLSKN